MLYLIIVVHCGNALLSSSVVFRTSIVYLSDTLTHSDSKLISRTLQNQVSNLKRTKFQHPVDAIME